MDLERIKLKENSSIKQALKIIGNERVRLGLIVDDDDKFLGVISDSNIRKALINGKKLNDDIKEIYTKNALTISDNTSEKKLLELSSKTDIYDFPVLDKNKKILGIKSIAQILNKKRLANKVILMAGGLGTRLAPLTKTTPKPMLKVGKKPILHTIIQRLRNQGFAEFIMCVNYKRKIIENYFKDGSSFDVKIDYIRERKKLGTAGALSLIEDVPNKSFIVMNADILTDLDFTELLNAHKKSKASMTVCLRQFSHQIPYGVIYSKKSILTDIKEKPMQSFDIAAGIYVLENKILQYIKKDEYLDMPDLIKIALANKEKICTYTINDYWIDIGRLSEYKKANEELIL